MASHNGPQDAPPGDAGPQAPIPAMPATARDDLFPGRPLLLLESGVRYSLGWQDRRGADPSFVLARRSFLDTVKVIERFPLTEQGWASAWQALSRRDTKAADAIAARLARRDAAKRAAAGQAALDAASLCHLRGVVLSGGSGVAPLTKGHQYDLRFLSDDLMVCLPQRVDAVVEVPYRDIESVKVSGPGQVSLSAAEVLTLVLGLGLVGALIGFGIHGVQGLLFGAFIGGLVGAVIALAATKTETYVRIRTPDAEYFFRHANKLPHVLRIELSDAFRAIGKARDS